MDFSSVDDFLRKAASAKDEKRIAIDDSLAPLMDDPSIVGVPVELLDAIEHLLSAYGDEAFRQIALFCLGRWLSVHADRVNDQTKTESWPEALHTMSDIGRLSSAMQTIEQIASFTGDEQWRKMLRSIIGQSVIEKLEESNSKVEDFMSEAEDYMDLFFGGK